MKQNLRKILTILLVCFSVTNLWGCGSVTAPEADSNAKTAPESVAEQKLEIKDYAAEVTLDMNSPTAKQEVTIHSYVDGDTTRFNVPTSMVEGGVLKARYLAIDTPESTGKIEEYGKAASRFTKEKLSKATSVIIESEDSAWNLDSTGTRYLAWVWYRTSDTEPYRNLNIEILQNGFARASSAANNQYGKTCMAALNQAKTQKLNVFSGKPDPDYFYGDAIELTLKELRCNVKDYEGKKVAFNGIVSKHYGNGVYVEWYDEETNMYYGMPIYYGFHLSGEGLDIISVGNEVRIVGPVSYYEMGETYQITGLTYRAMQPDDPGNIQKLSEGNNGAFVLTTADKLINGEVTLDVNGETKTYPYGQLALATSVEMKGLKVTSVSTTDDPDSSSFGAMTLHCDQDGIGVDVRTIVLKDENGETLTEKDFLNKTIDVKGIVDYFKGNYQIKVLSLKDINIIE